MSEEINLTPEEQVAKDLLSVLKRRGLYPSQIRFKAEGRPGRDFWADAPWRLDSSQEEIPFTFIVRDSEGAVQLKKIVISEDVTYNDPNRPHNQRQWVERKTFTDNLGKIDEKFWVYRPSNKSNKPPTVPRTEFEAGRGEYLRLRVVFYREARNKPRPLYELTPGPYKPSGR